MLTFFSKAFLWIFLSLPCCLFAQQQVQQWGRFEKKVNYHYKGNAFKDVQLSATFVHDTTKVCVQGFYDGRDTFILRYMPAQKGHWQFTTHSNIKELDNLKGRFDCIKSLAGNHGKVRVSETFYFKYADGTPFYPVGTTAYAWNHMGDGLQKITLASLKASAFNKLRMCVFPKNYKLVKEEPVLFPFKKLANKRSGDKAHQHIQWDLSRFNPLFFKKMETQIDALGDLGIEVDLILFHPYDKGRWGFDDLPMETNLQYLKYIMARLGSFRNVWWSVANEWDLVKTKTHQNWLDLSKYIYENDPYHHLCSIHGSTAKYFEYWLPYFTHASIQDEAPVMNWGAAGILRNAYHKPVIYDEVGYEGNLKSRWGRYSGEEMTYLMWMGAIGGTYVTHGETYQLHAGSDTIFWAKGGYFRGSSWKRAGFLRKVLEANPQPMEPADVSRDFKTATAGSGHYIIYFGKEMPEKWFFNLPVKNGRFDKPTAGDQFKVDILNTWEMTIRPVEGIFELGKQENYRFYDKDRKKIRLPLQPYIALRVTKINES